MSPPDAKEPASPFGRRMLVWALVAVLATPVFFLGVRLISAWRSGYTSTEMDWDGSGDTSFGEFLRAAEIGRRPVNIDGVTCTEYFSYRDGLVVKTNCPR